MINERQYFSISRDDVPQQSGDHILGPFDSGEKGLIWHRARVFGSRGEWCLSFYASDDPGDTPQWSEYYDKPDDILLYSYKGRYLHVLLKRNGSTAVFDRLRLYYPAHSFTRYLPGIYQAAEQNSFFPRFLALFQSVFLDLDEQIADFARLLDPGTADNTYLSLLAGWLGCEEFELLPESKRADFLLRCVKWYKGYGTRTVMSEILEWLCEVKPVIVEYADFEQFKDQGKLTRLFDCDMYTFTVLLHNPEFFSAAERLLEKMKPSYTIGKLVPLKDEIILDGHSYLGYNSVI